MNYKKENVGNDKKVEQTNRQKVKWSNQTKHNPEQGPPKVKPKQERVRRERQNKNGKQPEGTQKEKKRNTEKRIMKYELGKGVYS